MSGERLVFRFPFSDFRSLGRREQSQDRKAGLKEKAEIRNKKGDLRSLMSSRLRLMVPCTEIYHHSAGAVSVGDSKVSVDSTRVSCVNSSASVA